MNVFFSQKDLFKLYPIYSRNKPKSENFAETYFRDILMVSNNEKNSKINFNYNYNRIRIDKGN